MVEVPPGLKGVRVTDSEVGDVRGEEGYFHYRQHSAVELAAHRSLEDVWRLLIDGALPDADASATFLDEVRPLRGVPDEVAAALPAIAAAGRGSMVGGLRTALSLLVAHLDLRPTVECTPDELRADALRLVAVIPTLAGALLRLQQGEEPVAVRPDLGHAAHLLHQHLGEVPDPDVARALEQYLIITVDHGFNASTFTARVIASTGADLGSAVVGALGALSGPRHGGAPSRALDALDAIGDPGAVDDWVRASVGRGERIMGFGHSVYRGPDPRAVLLREVAQRLGGELVDLAVAVEPIVSDTLAELRPGQRISTNVEFYAGVVMARCGLPREAFTTTFAASRSIGWCANVLEQARDPRVIRPSARYVGPPAPQPVPPGP